MKSEIGKRLVGTGIAALFLTTGAAAYAENSLESITSPALRKQVAEVHQLAGEQYALGFPCDCCDHCGDICDYCDHCDMCDSCDHCPPY